MERLAGVRGVRVRGAALGCLAGLELRHVRMGANGALAESAVRVTLLLGLDLLELVGLALVNLILVLVKLLAGQKLLSLPVIRVLISITIALTITLAHITGLVFRNPLIKAAKL